MKRLGASARRLAAAAGAIGASLLVPALASAETINFGHASGSIVTAVVTPMENMAATLRLILYGVLLLVMVIGAVMRAMVHNPQLQMNGTKAITVSIELILLLTFAPLVLNWLTGISVPFTPSGG
ncbi:MAG: hypothetical protein K6V73_06390 [Firmicutes bacterium]|nr:hypothetical protein [Bacillota bacterium]